MPLVSALILNYRTPEHAVQSVMALKKQTIDRDLEVIVIDNHSVDDSIGVLRNRLKDVPGVRVVESPRNGGFSKGNNLGMRFARGKYVLIQNPDNTLAPDALETMVAVMEADPSIGIVAPKLVHEDGTIRDSARAFPGMLDVIAKRTVLRALFPGRMRRYLQKDADPQKTRDVDWAVGACLLVRADLLRALGGLDEGFFLFFEDIDLCRRCWEARKRVVYFPDAQASDRKRRLSEGGVWSLLRRPAGRAHVRSALRYFWKWRGCHSPRPLA